MDRRKKTLIASIAAVSVMAFGIATSPFLMALPLTYTAFPSLCPAYDQLPADVDPSHCMNVAMPGGLGLEMSVRMTQGQMIEFVSALKGSQVERFGERACKVQGDTASTTAYFETYQAAFVRVEWDGDTTHYSATDMVAHPCQQS